MSGGSFNYLFRRSDDLIPGDMLSMVEAIGRAHPGSKAAIDARALLGGLCACRDLWERLRYVMQAVEWERSGDWGDDAVDAQVDLYERVR